MILYNIPATDFCNCPKCNNIVLFNKEGLLQEANCYNCMIKINYGIFFLRLFLNNYIFNISCGKNLNISIYVINNNNLIIRFPLEEEFYWENIKTYYNICLKYIDSLVFL